MGTATTTDTAQMADTEAVVPPSDRCGDLGRAIVMYLPSLIQMFYIIERKPTIDPVYCGYFPIISFMFTDESD